MAARRQLAIPRLAVVALLLAAAPGCRDSAHPVRWHASTDVSSVTPGSVIPVHIRARTERGWYIYSVTQPGGGPIPTRIWLADTTTFEPAGSVIGPAPASAFDKTFGINVEKYLRDPSFDFPVRVIPGTSPGRRQMRINASYQACNDTVCLSPKTVTMTVPVTVRPP